MENKEQSNDILSLKTALWTSLGIGAFTAVRSIYQHITRYELEGKVVLITGGARGLGLAMARLLADKGCKLVLCSRNAQQLQLAETEFQEKGVEVLTIRADLTVQQEANQVVQAAITHFGQLDVLINNAGTMLVGPENTMEVEDYKKVADSNLWSALYMIKAAIPHFKSQGVGRIANICSIGGKIAVPHMLPYSVSKFAMVGLSEGLGAELKKDNIHVTTVIPNLMRTGSPRNITVKGGHEAEYAWFKTSASSPLLSQHADDAAKEIISGLQNGARNVTLTLTAKVAVALHGILPGAVESVMEFANRFLPESNNREEKSGHESESEKSHGIIADMSDEAALKFNEH
ncbi:SDR family oxidoreductase [Dyadobacter sp. CY323]|uniref:SDR family NAD(P)-dependent oxidoreductase n=1 Tax=Dyadobacter sp. CY323 TaxID=2907302 RepID=UPI001F42B77A|nr:SDR family oxidoreductase [Dyadobacter sp. CY323]MCE6987950.1 SDR family oxidoreductase [Dyadobacter sp. CY323]